LILPTAAGLRRQNRWHRGRQRIALKTQDRGEASGTRFRFCAADVGVAIVPASALPSVEQYDVVVKRLVYPAIVRSVGILRSKIGALTRRQVASWISSGRFF